MDRLDIPSDPGSWNIPDEFVPARCNNTGGNVPSGTLLFNLSSARRFDVHTFRLGPTATPSQRFFYARLMDQALRPRPPPWTARLPWCKTTHRTAGIRALRIRGRLAGKISREPRMHQGDPNPKLVQPTKDQKCIRVTLLSSPPMAGKLTFNARRFTTRLGGASISPIRIYFLSFRFPRGFSPFVS